MRETTSFPCKACTHAYCEHEYNLAHQQFSYTIMKELYNPVGMLMHACKITCCCTVVSTNWLRYCNLEVIYSIHAKITLLYIVVFSTSSIH